MPLNSMYSLGGLAQYYPNYSLAAKQPKAVSPVPVTSGVNTGIPNDQRWGNADTGWGEAWIGDPGNTFPGATGGRTTPTVPFTLNPATQAGKGAYGEVPGPIGMPDNLYKGVSAIYPGLQQTTANISDLISSQLKGEFTPETENALWDTAQRYGVASGMPGAALWSNRFMGNVAGAKEDLMNKGVTNYGNITSLLSRMVDDPNLAAAIASRNALFGSAPNPKLAAEEQYRKYLEALIAGRNMGTNPAGGTRTPAIDPSVNFGGASSGYIPTRRNQPDWPSYPWQQVNPATTGGSGTASNTAGGYATTGWDWTQYGSPEEQAIAESWINSGPTYGTPSTEFGDFGGWQPEDTNWDWTLWENPVDWSGSTPTGADWTEEDVWNSLGV